MSVLLPTISNSGVAFSSHAGAGGMNFWTGPFLWGFFIPLQVVFYSALTSFSAAVMWNHSIHFLFWWLRPSDIICHLTSISPTSAVISVSEGEKIISFISAANIQQKVWITINHAGSLMTSYYKHESIWKHRGPEYILHLYECRNAYFSAQYSYFKCAILLCKTSRYILECQRSSPWTCIWHLLLPLRCSLHSDFTQKWQFVSHMMVQVPKVGQGCLIHAALPH